MDDEDDDELYEMDSRPKDFKLNGYRCITFNQKNPPKENTRLDVAKKMIKMLATMGQQKRYCSKNDTSAAK